MTTCPFGPVSHPATLRLDRLTRERVAPWDCIHDWEYPHRDGSGCDFQEVIEPEPYWFVSYVCDDHLDAVRSSSVPVVQVVAL